MKVRLWSVDPSPVAHIYSFSLKPISAGEFRDKAQEISSYLGYGGCEIFPKQEQVLVERGDVGNFINLPYFDAKQTLRFAIKEDGEAATLKEFLQLVDGRTVEPEAFVGLTFGKQISEFKVGALPELYVWAGYTRAHATQ